MTLECYLLPGAQMDIHPAPRRRDWMDDTPHAFAYRCLPLSMANSHGWEIRCTGSFEARWNGGQRPEDIEVIPDNDGTNTARSHFGCGILSFEPSAIFRTPPGFNLWVTGPVNRWKDGLQPLSALVETDWIPFTFSMNWKFTRSNSPVCFQKGEPFCFIFPVQRGLVEQFDPTLRDLSSDAELERQYKYALRKRSFSGVLSQLRPNKVDQLKRGDLQRIKFQNWYTRGNLPDESASAPDHQKTVQVKPFKR